MTGCKRDSWLNDYRKRVDDYLTRVRGYFGRSGRYHHHLALAFTLESLRRDVFVLIYDHITTYVGSDDNLFYKTMFKLKSFLAIISMCFNGKRTWRDARDQHHDKP
jgi:hypothetical protein